MARGATAAPTAPAPAGGDGAPGEQPAAIPDKYLVNNEAGEVDWQASALKQAQGYQALSTKLGTDAPPKSPDEYAPELPNGLTMDALKGDPMFAGFLKGAHAKGLSNAQVSYVLAEFQQRVQLMQEQAADPAIAEAELGKVWTTQQQMKRGLESSWRGTQAFAVDAEHAARLDKKFGSDPDFLRLMAKVGAELGEDTLPDGGLTSVEAETLDSLIKSAAYNDAKHPEHAKAVAQANRLYAKRFPQ